MTLLETTSAPTCVKDDDCFSQDSVYASLINGPSFVFSEDIMHTRGRMANRFTYLFYVCKDLLIFGLYCNDASSDYCRIVVVVVVVG